MVCRSLILNCLLDNLPADGPDPVRAGIIPVIIEELMKLFHVGFKGVGDHTVPVLTKGRVLMGKWESGRAA